MSREAKAPMMSLDQIATRLNVLGGEVTTASMMRGAASRTELTRWVATLTLVCARLQQVLDRPVARAPATHGSMQTPPPLSESTDV